MPKELSRGLDASTEINKIDQHSSKNNPAERQLSHCQCSPPRLRVADKNQDILPRPPSSVTARDKHRDDSTLPRWSVADDNDTSKKKKKKKGVRRRARRRTQRDTGTAVAAPKSFPIWIGLTSAVQVPNN